MRATTTHLKRNHQQTGARSWGIHPGQRNLRKAVEALSASYCSAQNGESLWDVIYRVIKETENREDILLQAELRRSSGTLDSRAWKVAAIKVIPKPGTDD
ncbi:hypothetical protein EVAR_62810_1 [Eumeta japonica]|uniref:Uncharacterized protein n=1 Tax=Eumeta variegata TaxID=151549 RepID=A0A4C1ZN32_EUMVA|nr:hypothetical protein EVAR_62810_1 [Eumeta japonica]